MVFTPIEIKISFPPSDQETDQRNLSRGKTAECGDLSVSLRTQDQRQKTDLCTIPVIYAHVHS